MSPNQPDLFSPEYFAKKQQQRIASLTPQDFEPWEEARERYIKTQIEPMHDRYRQSDHDWFKDFNRRRGTVMHSSDIIHTLQRLNPSIFVQQQINFPDDWGLYLDQLGRIQFLTGVPKGWLTEFSYSIVDDRDLPLHEKRGWRTVVVYCLMKGAITWKQVMTEFGDPDSSFNEERWHRITHDFRIGGDQVAQRNIANVVEG